MMTAPAHALPLPDTMRSFVAIVSNDATAAHAHARTLARLEGADAARNAADAVHHLTMLHGRHPGVVDHAAARVTELVSRKALFAIAEAFAVERDLMARLVVAAGPIPSTPGQAETEASVVGQRHAIDLLAQSDRGGCAVGAALAVVLDWHAVRRVLDATARRFGVEATKSVLPEQVELVEIATERALLFGAQQIADQHRGLWDLLEARAKARGPY